MRERERDEGTLLTYVLLKQRIRGNKRQEQEWEKRKRRRKVKVLASKARTAIVNSKKGIKPNNKKGQQKERERGGWEVFFSEKKNT